MLQNVLDRSVNTQSVDTQLAHLLGDFFPHVSAQACYGKADFPFAVIGARPIAVFLVGLEHVTHPAVGILVIHVIVRMAVRDGKLHCRPTCFSQGHAFFKQGVEGGVVKCQELFVSLLAKIAMNIW